MLMNDPSLGRAKLDPGKLAQDDSLMTPGVSPLTPIPSPSFRRANSLRRVLIRVGWPLVMPDVLRPAVCGFRAFVLRC